MDTNNPYQNPYQNNNQNSDQNPYQNNNQNGSQNPYGSAYRKQRQPGDQLSSAALVLGIIALISAFTFTVYPCLILGSLSIILALLSRGSQKKLLGQSRTAVVFAIIGLSGAGKSTLIRTINRMIDITGGQLIVDNTDVMTLKGKSLRRFRRTIGMIFQSFNLITRATVIKNVLTSYVPDMPWYKVLFGVYSKEQKMKALEALDKVGILDKAYTRCDELSGGQQQRVALARTLCQSPTIILADEPVASLDPIMADEVMDDFKRVNQDMNISILLNIHHVDLALKYATRVVGVRAGKIVYDGPVSSVTKEVLDEVYNGAEIPQISKEKKNG